MRSWRSRSAKAALFALAVAVSGAGNAGAAPLSRIAVRAEIHGAGWMAAEVRRQLPEQLRQELARQGVDQFPAGARLILNVREIYLADDPGFRGGWPGNPMQMPDAIEGEVIVTDSRGRPLLSKPVSGRSTPLPAFGLPAQANATRRIAALTAALAYWTARGLK